MFRPRAHPPLPRKRRRRASDEVLLLGCPRLCPLWQRRAFRALVKPKPHLKEAILHRPAEQIWPKHADETVDRALALAESRLALSPSQTHRHSPGDFHLLLEFPPDRVEHAKALAVLLSRSLPDLWFTLGPLYLKNARFFRPRPPYSLDLQLSKNVHLRKDLRRAILKP